MPDRYSDPDEPAEVPDDIWAAEQRAIDNGAEVARCALCDDTGYAGFRVCDHRPHSTPAGREAAREILREALQRPDGAA